MHFKTNRPTGKYRSFSATTVDIVEHGKKCGWIQGGLRADATQVWLHVKDENEKCGWKNRCLINHHNSIAEAKQWVKTFWKDISVAHAIHYLS